MLYPLRFRPIFRQYLWGGRRLATVLGKSLGEGDTFAESWEIVDHGTDQSQVEFGPLVGATLGRLVQDHGKDLLGRHAPQKTFPLLLKFLDAQRDLSVQVHPDDSQAQLLNPPDLGKTEAWVILDVMPGSHLFAGLKPGIDRQNLTKAIATGQIVNCLHRVEPKVGDCYFIEAGTVHALGAGLMVVEIQQASDTTYRLFDWNRVTADGQPRPLHVTEALEAIKFSLGPVHAQRPQPTADAEIQQLVSCQHFVIDRWHFTGLKTLPLNRSCHLLSVLEGSVHVEHDPSGLALNRGQSILLPACCKAVQVKASASALILDIYLP
ncbi:MAG: class I mannose-6-phosphate isomerase [Pirellulaceae bacterium]|nr:class I mannose-6-phosphate isomerase [Pirellulaceae bacterium]